MTPSPHRSGNRWRLAGLATLALFLIVSAAAALHFSTLLERHTEGLSRYVQVDVVAWQQTDYALQEFRSTFARHVAGDNAATMDTVNARLDQAVDTLPLLQRGVDYEQLRLLVDIDNAVDFTRSALAEIKGQLVDKPDYRGDLLMLRQIDALLTPQTVALRQLAIDAALRWTEQQDGDLGMARWLTGMIRWALIAVLALVAVFIGLLLREIRAARRAQKQAMESEEKARFVAEHDSLTGLPNRLQFQQRLDACIAQAHQENLEVALHMINLDGFRDIKESFGPEVGDILLRAVAERITGMVAADTELVRLAGDEFALIQSYEMTQAGSQAAANSVIEACARPFKIAEREIHLAVSVGLARFPEDAEDSNSLLKAACLALNAAKQDGGRFECYSPEMAALLLDRQALEQELRQALADNALEVYYQPQVRFPNQTFVGAEALARWNHPTRGWISPGSFIPIAEESGLVLLLGRWIMEAACREALQWPGESTATVAVNISPSQFIHQDIVAMTCEVLEATGLPAGRLELEITEGMLMHDEHAAIRTLEGLHKLGVKLAIDDFGTGYTSLSYLKRFKVDKLKIDQSFVRDMDQDRSDQMIVSAVIELADSLGMQTIAEGIETSQQMTILDHLGCDDGQGYYFGRPMAAANLRKFIADSQKASDPGAILRLA